MKKKVSVFLLTGIMAMGLCACNLNNNTTTSSMGSTTSSTVEDKGSVTTSSDTTQATDLSDLSNSIQQPAGSSKFVYVKDQSNDWQNAYFEKLTMVRNQNDTNLQLDEYTAEVAYDYFLYDSDYNGVPEIYIMYGTCEADYFLDIYEYNNGELKSLGQMGAGHTSYYSTPSQGLMAYWGHMGSASVSTLKLVNGEFQSQEISSQVLPDDGSVDYTEADALIPGALYINMIGIKEDIPLLLYGSDSVSTKDDVSNDQAKTTIENTYLNNGNVYGVSVDGFGGDTGIVSFNDYLKPGMVYDYMDHDAVVKNSQWVDLNQDGQDECVLLLSYGDDGYSTIYVVLSLQDGNVYAYSLHYIGDIVTFNADGSFQYRDYYYNHLVFFKDQCYRILK